MQIESYLADKQWVYLNETLRIQKTNQNPFQLNQ